MAESAGARVYRGQSVDIPLRAGGRIPGPLRFIIRSQPSQGSLSEPRATGRNTAVITYSHDARFPGGTDSFRFAVQSVDSPVSAPADIQIQVQDPPARIEIIPSLDFGEVPAGSHMRKQIIVANTGGTSLAVAPSVSLPWALEDTAPKTVAPGGTQSWTLVFSPSSRGDFSGEFQVPGSPPATTKLSGRAIELFSVAPDRPIVLSNAKNREASFLLINPTPRPLTIHVKSPEGILIRPTVNIPAGDKVSMELAADPHVLNPVSGTLVLECEGFRKEIPVKSEALPAILFAEPATGFNIPLSSSPLQISKTLTLKNRGGSPARLEVRSPVGVVIAPAPSSVIIAPGKSQTFEVSFETGGIQATIADTIEILADGANPVMIPLRYEKLPSTANAIPMPTPGSGLPTFPSLKELQPEPDNAIPAIPEIRLVSRQPGLVQIAWDHPSPDAKSFVIEVRSLEYVGDDAPPLSKWTKFPYARFQERDGKVLATMNRLPPDSSWFIRVVSLDANGKRSAPSEAVRISSPPHPPRPWVQAGLIGFFIAGVIGFVIRNIVRSGQTRKKEEATRISRLEGE